MLVSARIDRELVVARRLLEAASVEPEDHLVLAENVASYLHQLKPGFVEELETRPTDQLMFALKGGYANGDRRWTQKLFRDLEKPYSDAEVVARATELETSFRATARAIRNEHQPYPCRFFVTGSATRGRFGANSDLDVICEVDRPARSSGWGEVSVQFTRDADSFGQAFGQFQEVDPEQEGLVQGFLADGLAAKGYRLEGAAVVASEGPVERELEKTPPSSMIWDFSDLP